MNRLFSFFIILFASICFLTACEKDNKAIVYPTLVAYLESQPSLSMFLQALDKAQLQTFKNGQGPFTWIAPSNDAFLAAGITQDSMNRMTPGQLSYLLLYQLINPTSIPLKPVFTADMVAQRSFARATQLGQNFYLGNYKDSFFVNGGSLISTNNNVANGVVHIINRVNVPPVLRGNIQSVLTTTGQHSLFIAALTRAIRWATLGTTAVYTVIAPTDAAMTTAGYTLASINAAPVAQMDSLVRYHMFSGSRLFTNDFGDYVSPGTFLSNLKTIQASGFGRKLKGVSNSTPIDIIVSNLLGTNGVTHVVNGVLRY